MKKIIVVGLITMLIGANLFAEKISTYKHAVYKNANDVKRALTTNGLQVVGEYNAMQNSDYHVIAYTCPTLTKYASQKGRAFAGVQKVLINNKDKELVLTNPQYFLHAFMQDDFQVEGAKKVNNKLVSAFGTLKNSEDALDDDEIAEYHFMMAMPYYEDMIAVAKGDNLKEKLEKNATKNIVFTLEAGEATLYGVAMPTEKGEKYYVSEIKGEKQSAFLPYMVVVEGNTAKILHPKYYLAIAFPNLSMGEFMAISGTPGDIEEYFTSLFK